MAAAFFPGSTDMVKFWTKLGFVKKIMVPVNQSEVGSGPRGGAHEVPVWVEQDRQNINGFD